eukprot:SRR837773.20197.p1 GENE.SRR837773.20197~~SRR837773.20197.p1  ORF type:complete len:304 (-),score=75.57 SRR837773.20197:19-930(-)
MGCLGPLPRDPRKRLPRASRSIVVEVCPTGHPLEGQLRCLARRPLAVGEVAGSYCGELRRGKSGVSDYSCAGSKDGEVVDGRHFCNEAAFVNHFHGIGPRANVQFQQDDDRGACLLRIIWNWTYPGIAMLRAPLAATLRAARRPVAPVAGRAFAAAPGEGGQPGSPPNPFAVFEQFAKDATTQMQQAAQRLNEVASTGPGPAVQDLQSLAQSNVAVVSERLVPLFSAMLIVARSTSGQQLTPAQEEVLEKVMPAQARDTLKNVIGVLPEDPQVEQLKRIASLMESIETKLDVLQKSIDAGKSH